jgi:uncharacterized SAM-binding protein YcdF (DUF218 family)
MNFFLMKLTRRFKIIFASLLLFGGWIIVAPFFAENLIVEKPLERADAMLVLAGSATYIERTQKAAELFQKGVAPLVLLTDDGTRGGWSRAEQRNPPFVELARKNLIAAGVPAENIEILQPQVAGTIDEAELLGKTVRQRNLKRILLVTSAYHTRRTLWTFKKAAAAGENLIIGIESAPPGVQTPPPAFWWLSPTGWQTVAGEYVKGAYYWVFY